MQKLKALEILKDIKENYQTTFIKNRIKVINKAIEELEQYEQSFKQKEFDYRTQCQNVVSAARLEADDMPDRLAELEKVILDYYLAKGYQFGVGGWGFNIEIESNYKSKQLLIYFMENKHEHYLPVFGIDTETTKELFDKAIEFFKGVK